MSRSDNLRSQDWRAILRLVGECRELGDDKNAWRGHCVEQLAKLVDANVGFCGEMSGVNALKPVPLGAVDWGWDSGFNRSLLIQLHDELRNDPNLYTVALRYYEKAREEDGACHTRRHVMEDRDWYKSNDYHVVQRACGLDHQLQCFRKLSGGNVDEYSGLVLNRAHGRRDFSSRDLALVRETHAALGPLIGGPLARYCDPSPGDLAPRVRQVLACMLEGDGDKQIAARLKLSRFTINQYTKSVFRHFGVGSRSELLSRWIRRGYSTRFPWLP